MKWWQLLLIGLIILALGYFIGKSQSVSQGQNLSPTPTQQLNLQTTISTSPTPKETTTASNNFHVQQSPGGGPQNDIIEIQPISASQPVAQVGDDITFTVTIKNQAPYKKFIQAICFNSSDGNFGCATGKNLGPNETFNINNSGRFKTPGIKSVWITWSQDNQNYYRPVSAGTATVTIQ